MIPANRQHTAVFYDPICIDDVFGRSASNINHERNKALAGEINKLWSIPIPRIMIEIKRKGYTFIQETFTQVQKNPNARNPAALFLWTIKQVKVEMTEYN